MADGSGKIRIAWADDEHEFRLGLGELRELQDKTGAGPLELHRRIGTGVWRVDDLRETIRLGLIGGGKTPPDALKLVARYVDARPLAESVGPAARILFAAIMGPENDPLGKMMAADDPAQNGQTVSSPSPPFTEQAPRSE